MGEIVVAITVGAVFSALAALLLSIAVLRPWWIRAGAWAVILAAYEVTIDDFSQKWFAVLGVALWLFVLWIRMPNGDDGALDPA